MKKFYPYTILAIVVLLCIGAGTWYLKDKLFTNSVGLLPKQKTADSKKTGFFSIGGQNGNAVKPEELKPNTDILYLTQPVTKLFGRIDQVQGSTVFLTQRFIIKDAQGKTLGNRDLTFRLTVIPDTKIVQLNNYVPYLFKTVVPQQNEILTVKDLNVW